jgi:dTDP-4-dehydrorhamnose reductase
MPEIAPVGGALQMWGGIECTVNRVRDVWYDQMQASGHARRGSADLELIAGLGVRVLRYPVLWELHDRSAGAQWEETDARMELMRELGIEPVVGLVHHGSGPPHTNLVHEEFATGLAEHARRVAERYPWVRWYTPVNEPLTTARFSALYGLWYPHTRSDRSFARAVVNQCLATSLSMAAIRTVNPAAQLLQTDDVGHIYGTPRLQYQVRLENERRWITWDLLCGRIERGAPMMEFLLRAGIATRELGWFAEHPCPPDMIGLNHYVTSDRFLDHRVELYPRACIGGNGRDRYADVEAVRILPAAQGGWRTAIEETWARYRLPIAITEAHLGCTREEQLRWLADAWREAQRARSDGIDVRAVTAWALLGSYNWNILLTRDSGHYEPGAFDVRGGTPRATALAQSIRELAAGAPTPLHPVLGSPGWWNRDIRMLHRGPSPRGDATDPPAGGSRRRSRPVLITGARGNLGTAFAQICELRGLQYQLCGRKELDICTPGSTAGLLESVRPWAIINAAGYARIDQAEQEPERCFRENSEGARVLSQACAAHRVRLVTFSSDLVFDGASSSPYLESSDVRPLNILGWSKARGERAVLDNHPEALVVRTSSLFGPWHPHSFLDSAMQALARREPFAAMHDVVVSPTYVPDLVNACLDLLIDGEHGIWHLANRGSVSWVELARRGALLAGMDPARVIARSCAEFALAAPRPAFSVLATERGLTLPTLDDALARHARAA